jgi:hypothetical protein
MSNNKISEHVARSQQEQGLAAKIDESAARTAQDFAVTNSFLVPMKSTEMSLMREINYSKPIRVILDTIRHKIVWTFGSLLSRETLYFFVMCGTFPSSTSFVSGHSRQKPRTLPVAIAEITPFTRSSFQGIR